MRACARYASAKVDRWCSVKPSSIAAKQGEPSAEGLPRLELYGHPVDLFDVKVDQPGPLEVPPKSSVSRVSTWIG